MMSPQKQLPRLPLDGSLDLTFRCDNHCLHCWLWVPSTAQEIQDELSFDEIKRIVDEARQMGCQAWKISGGEPMLRPDFPEIFDYVTRKAVHYSLNTNGGRITPEIARLMTRRGRKMVALYGATAEVHDRVTRHPGSFEAMRRGLAYLAEAGAGFEMQVIPMRANIHQYEQMLALAQTLSPNVRIGATWLYLSACGSAARNREILQQRLDPADVLAIDEPNPAYEPAAGAQTTCSAMPDDGRLFAPCIAGRRDFHIDPYGKMSFCCFIKDPALRYDLRHGSFQEAWDAFIPGLSDVVRASQEYWEGCGACDLRSDCRWCPVYGYLEHGRYDAKVDYLCQVAAETRRYKADWRQNHRRYYQIAGLTVQVSADFPFTDETFDPKFETFRVNEPSEDLITIHHVLQIPERSELRLGEEIYHQPPWAVYRQKNSFVYIGIPPEDMEMETRIMMIMDAAHTSATIYHQPKFNQTTGLGALTSLPSDQLLLARILADRQAFFVHASGIRLDGSGLLFLGQSGAGKSTMLKLLRGQGEILCDDRMIVRKWPEGFRIHGTWSHGELPDVSPAEAPLRAVLFLEQAHTNQLIPMPHMHERLGALLDRVVRPLVDAGWWEKTLDTAGALAAEVPFYRLQFDLSGEVVDLLKPLYQ
jgi:MoaA/NifB/PqqE/SkfB family radical SAM enzyme